MRYLAVGLIVAVVVVLAVGPLVLGRRQVARQTGRPIQTRGLLPVAIVVTLLVAGVAVLGLFVPPSAVFTIAAVLAVVIAATVLIRARTTPVQGLPKVPTLLFLLAGGAIATVGIAALMDLLVPAAR